MDARHTEITALLSERIEAAARERLATEAGRARTDGHHRLAQIRALIGRALAGAGPGFTDQPIATQPVTGQPVIDQRIPDQPVTDQPIADDPGSPARRAA